ncbi:hypothetical protein [Sphingomonas sp. MM-1]|uniref:hypothetical protein n=1 Tax=Sphingomonas sp. MM-1 TaxID=745310 RepID=UPI0011837B73|nr:hypothetical protein [Sphingomonas sp. MM-1]
MMGSQGKTRVIDPGQAPTTIRRPTVWANFQMKPLGRFTPEPPPPRAEIWKVSIALALLVLGIGIALFSFYDAGAISDDVFVAVVVFVIAVCIGVILSLDWEQTAHRRVRQPWQEVPPPFDFIGGHSVESTLNNAKRERMANARCERTGA